MSVFHAIRRLFARAAHPRRWPRQVRHWLQARYDAALTTDDNRRHWAAADALSARSANSPGVRRTLRNRARYEVANNAYAKGIVLTLANDIVGTGPRLQLLTQNPAANRSLEQAFMRWARAVRLAEKLCTLVMARATDGEGFCLLTSNPKLSTPVQLELRLVEAEQVSTPIMFNPDPRDAVDGIIFDEHGNPLEYHFLRAHPGDTTIFSLEMVFDRIPAESVIHLFRADRPGQFRGVPDITPALALFAMLRDYSLATLDAAKAAACYAGIVYTDAPPGGESEAVEPMDSIELDRNTLLTMPGGWKISQLEAQQPTGTFAEFKREILNEIGRAVNMPFNVTAGNSSGYNYASGRLDHQTYFKALRVEQHQLELVVLDRILRAWLDEAALIPGLVPDGLGPMAEWSHQWFFDGHEHVDPLKEANAQATRLASHTTTLADEYARRGQDWETQLNQRAKEVALMQQLGLPSPFSSSVISPQEQPDAYDLPDEPGADAGFHPQLVAAHCAQPR